MRTIPSVKGATGDKAQTNAAISENLSADPLVSIVILSLERGEDLRRNIESLKETVNIPYEVIIVDNDSKGKATLDYLNEIDGQPTGRNGKIFVHRNKKNVGCSAGRKLGTEIAFGTKSKYILTVDNDVTYMSGWLDKLISEIEKSEEIGAVSPLILRPYGDGKLRVQWNGGRLDIIGDYFIRFLHVDKGKVYGEDQLGGGIECDWLHGTLLLIKKDIATKIGYSTYYLSNYEDFDYSFQIAELGYKMINVPDSIIIHHHISLQDAEKQKREEKYLHERFDPHRIFESVMTFTERTGFNVGIETDFNTWRDNKIFLTQKGYPDLLGEGTSFNDVSIEEAKRAYEAITKERKKRGIATKRSIDMEKVFDNIPSGKKIKLQQKIKKYIRTRDIKELLGEELIRKFDSGDNYILERPSQVEFLLEQIAQMAEVIDDLGSEIGEQHLTIMAKEFQNDSLNKAIVAKDQHINNLNKAIIAKEEHINNLNQAIVAKDQRIANLEGLIRDRDAERYQNLMNLTKEIIKIKKYSVFYNLLSRFRKELLRFFSKIRG